MNIIRNFSLFLLVFAFALGTGCSRDGAKTEAKSLSVSDPNNFAAYINPVAGLASGDYVVEANADTAGEVGEFTLSIFYDDGSTDEYTGTWSSSTSSREFFFTLYQAGGIKIRLQGDIDSNLRLINDNGFVISSRSSNSDGRAFIVLEQSRIDSENYGKAYYEAIDPLDEKDTLEKWKQVNGFYEADAAGRVIEPRFRDTKDLGYGRGLRMWTRPDGSLYFFVENFQVRTVPGLEYTTLNLNALLQDIRPHHFGSNAIEFSTYPYGPGEPCGHDSGAECAAPILALPDPTDPPKFAKFFTFDATQGDQTREDHENETRLDTVNLDGRGHKAMPGACVYCHGGTLRPLREDGTFRDNSLNGTGGNGINGDTNAKLQLMEVPSFEYGDYSPYTKAEQEPIIKQANMAIYCTYPNLPPAGVRAACAQYCVDPDDTANCDGNGTDILDIFDTTTGEGEWRGDFATEMTEGWYDDPDNPAMFDRATFNEDYVPPGWQHDSSDNIPPPDSDRLFLEVVQPICFVCHSRRGTTLGSNIADDGSKDIDFSSYEKFISHADQIKLYVYDRGVMPLSLRGYNAFWGSDAPEILAAHLNGVLAEDNRIEFNDDDEVDQPGKVVADAGPDRVTTSPVRLFGSNTRFADRYSWQIISAPDGSDASLLEGSTSRPVLNTTVDGLYEIQLSASYEADSDTDTVFIRIDNTMTSSTTPQDPKTITLSDILAVMQTPGDDANSSLSGTNGQKACEECHASNTDGGISGVPVFWRTDASQPGTGTTFYEEVLARVDFKDPENSLLLTKPSGNHHYGGQREGFEIDNPANRQHYDLFLNWILEGAPEN